MPIIAIILLIVAIICACLAVLIRSVRRTEVCGIVVQITQIVPTVLYKLGFGLIAALCLWGAGVLSGWWAL